jgi:hypothetical protein
MAGFASSDRAGTPIFPERKSVQTFTELFAGFEIGNLFLANWHRIPGSRVAPDAGVTLFDGKSTETAQFDPISTGERIGNFIKDRCNNPFDIALIEMRIQFSKSGNQFRFCHFQAPSCSC